jgi:DNA polymerase III delta subunit
MIALIHGPDRAIARLELERLVAERDPERESTTHFDGREVSLSHIMAAVGTRGFFGGGRVVVVHDLMAKVSRGGKGGEAEGEEDAATIPPSTSFDPVALFAAVPAENFLILIDPSLSSIPAAIKRAAPADATIIAADPPRGRALLTWMSATARELGGELDTSIAQLLAATLYPQSWMAKSANPRYDRPPDTELLRREIEKLVLFAHPDGVRADHVNALVAAMPEDRLFRFIENASEGSLRAAVTDLGQLLLAGEEPAKLSAQLAQQIELMTPIAAAPGKDPVAIGRELGLTNPNRMSSIARSRLAHDLGASAYAVGATVASDRALKRGLVRQPEDMLYALLATLPAPRDPRTGGPPRSRRAS